MQVRAAVLLYSVRPSVSKGDATMKRFKIILAATDLSPEAGAAVAYAGHLARAEGAKLVVVNVPHSTTLLFTDFSPPIDMLDLDTQIEDAARGALTKWVSRHLKKVTNVEIVVRQGITHEVICDLAEEIGASVIVMATHGRKGLSHVLLGSVTERVLRQAPCPVLVVKPPVPAKSAKKTSKKKARTAKTSADK